MHHTAAVLLLLELLAPVITLEDNEILKAISAPQDVKYIVFSLGSNKFPCLYFLFFIFFFILFFFKFQMSVFFKYYWDSVKFYFENAKLLKSLKHILLALLPEIKRGIFGNNLHPISLSP